MFEQVQNPKNRGLPGDFRARQTAWEGPREGPVLGSSTKSTARQAVWYSGEGLEVGIMSEFPGSAIY
jgi:hypothetical protein